MSDTPKRIFPGENTGLLEGRILVLKAENARLRELLTEYAVHNDACANSAEPRGPPLCVDGYCLCCRSRAALAPEPRISVTPKVTE